jgi:hypothetical protein
MATSSLPVRMALVAFLTVRLVEPARRAHVDRRYQRVDIARLAQGSTNAEIHPFPHGPVGTEGRIGSDRDALNEDAAVGQSAGKGVVTPGCHLSINTLELIISHVWQAGDHRIA